MACGERDVVESTERFRRVYLCIVTSTSSICALTFTLQGSDYALDFSKCFFFIICKFADKRGDFVIPVSNLVDV